MSWLLITTAAFAGSASAVFATPARVRYTESIDIAASAEKLFDYIRYQEHLMRWSAWPSETGSSCVCEGADGEVGARTVFFTRKGDRFGYQEVTALEKDRRVELILKSKGPPQRPKLVFELVPISPERTSVLLHFDNMINRPFNLIMRIAGIVRWTRGMHVKDLDGLKRYAEPPHRTYTGEAAGDLKAA